MESAVIKNSSYASEKIMQTIKVGLSKKLCDFYLIIHARIHVIQIMYVTGAAIDLHK